MAQSRSRFEYIAQTLAAAQKCSPQGMTKADCRPYCQLLFHLLYTLFVTHSKHEITLKMWHISLCVVFLFRRASSPQTRYQVTYFKVVPLDTRYHSPVRLNEPCAIFISTHVLDVKCLSR